MTLYKTIKAYISFEDYDKSGIVISQEIREYLENHPTRKLHEDDFDEDDTLFTIDIDKKTIKKMEELAKTDVEKELVKEMKDYDWMNIDIQVIIWGE